MIYRIREVDGTDDDVADALSELHTNTFYDPKLFANPDNGHWWIAYLDKEPVAFAGIVPSTMGPGVGYLKRAGVLRQHRGQGLQRRLLMVRESRARRNGWHRIVTDTTNNPPSANNLIRAGYRIFQPEVDWAFSHSIYWTKSLV